MIFSSVRPIHAVVRGGLCAAVLALLAAGPAEAQDPASDTVGNSIEHVDAVQTGEGVILTIQLKSAVAAAPNSFSVSNPARVALDLPGTVNDLGRNSVEINQGDLRSVNVVQAQGRARVVLNLRKASSYAINVDGNTIQVALGGATDTTTFRPQPVATDAAAAAAGAPVAAARALRGIDFRRGADGEGRVVLNLRRPVPYTLNVKGNSVVVALGVAVEAPTFPAAAAAPGATATAVAAAPSAVTAASEARSIRNLDFRRGTDGEGRIVVDLSDPNTSVDVHQQGQTVIVDFAATNLPENLRRRLDVTDFGTPVAQITGSQQGANAHLVIEPRGLWEQNAYQSDNRFVVEVKPVKEDPTRLFQGSRKGYQGERLSLNFQNVDVRSLLQVIADFTNLNIITSDSVQGSITLRLKDVPWDQALDIILQSKGLDMRKNGNVILVGPRDELATKEKLDLEARSQIAELEPVHTENFVINYQKVDDVRKMLTGAGAPGVAGGVAQSMISKRGSLVIDPRTNQIFVTDTSSRLEEIRRLITRIDIPVRQVMIEARIVEATDSFSSDIGARLGGVSVTGHSWLSSGTGYAGGASYGTSSSSPNTLTVNNTVIGNPNNVNLPAGSLNGYSPGSIGLTLFNSSITKLLNLEVEALELDGRGKVISSPRVITADKVKASIEEGQDIPYQSASAGGGIGQVQFRKAVLSLEVTPQITPEGAIFLDVKVNKDTPSATVSGSGGIAIDTKNVTTQVLVENGGTIVLGGIFQETELVTITKVPLLGDIPVLGNLFKDTAKTHNRDELLIFITPRIVSERLNQAGQ
jgi:type IV pilus assembly protein PilQ